MTYRTQKKSSNRETAVELMRIIGCLTVIGCHSYLSIYVGEGYDKSRTYIACLCADAVAFFWLIFGFFLFNNNNYRTMLQKVLKRIALPMVLVGFFSFFLYDFLTLKSGLLDSICQPVEEWIEFRDELIIWLNPFPHMGHFWYVFTYIMVVAIYPVLKSFYDWMTQDDKREKTFVIVSFCGFLLNDFTHNKLFAFSHHSINAAVPACIFILYGALFYKYKERLLKNKKIWVLMPVLFFALNLVRAFIQIHRDDISILYWYTGFGALASVCVAIFCFSLLANVHNKSIHHLICNISSHTFMIYLIHRLVIDVLSAHGFQNILQTKFVSDTSGAVGEIIYTLISTLTVFAISLAISAVLSIRVSQKK